MPDSRQKKITYAVAYRTGDPYYQGEIFGQIIASYDYSSRNMACRLVEKSSMQLLIAGINSMLCKKAEL